MCQFVCLWKTDLCLCAAVYGRIFVQQSKSWSEHQGDQGAPRRGSLCQTYSYIYICVSVNSVPLSKQCLLVNIYKIYMISKFLRVHIRVCTFIFFFYSLKQHMCTLNTFKYIFHIILFYLIYFTGYKLYYSTK